MSRRQKKMTARIIVAAVLWISAMLIPAEGIWSLAAFLVPYAVIGYDVLWGALRKIFRGQMFDEQFLMAIATVGAFAINEYTEACAVMLFYQVGELFQSIAVGKSRRSIAALMDIRPDFATVIRDGAEQTVSPEEVAVGEIIVVRPGEKIPLDGVIVSGSTSVNTSSLTGESLPSDKAKGDKVISGSVNLSSVINVRTESVYEDSTVAKILELVENSSEKKAKIENFITRFARWYTPCVVTGALLLAVIPSLVTGDWAEWINRALIFLVVSCPCALVISVPLSFFGGIGGASREGILIKGANYLEVLSTVDTVVFDKTGTLTSGSFAVSEIRANGISEKELLRIAAMAESFSIHPVSKCIVSAYEGTPDKSLVREFGVLGGLGIKAVIEGEKYYLGNAALMSMAGVKVENTDISGTVVHVSRGKEYLGCITVRDAAKQGASEAVSSLRSLGIKKTVMLTGDNAATAESIGKEIGIDEIHSELLPADKVTEVEKLISQGAKIAFVGDGINDAPALRMADVGVAMGRCGQDSAIEAADVVIMSDNLTRLPTAVRIARKTVGIAKQNIVFAIGVKLAILGLISVGFANMWLAVFADVGVAVIAILNAMRALRAK